jgi:tRNA (cmo5U34)-methyltransferase
MTEFTDSRWSDSVFSQGYRDSADDFIPDRSRLIGIAQFLYRHFMGGRTGNSVLDLGCGDGLFVQELIRIDPDLEATMVDGAAEMLAVARQRLTGHPRIGFVLATFQELLSHDPLKGKFDFVLSSLAIHHLCTEEKESLFAYVNSHLNPGGMFAIVDVVRASTDILENAYLGLWEEWILCNCEPSKRAELQAVPGKYRDNPDNRPDCLMFQLRALEKAGFRNVDCFYKNGIFAAYGGTKDT